MPELSGGHRIETTKAWNIPFEDNHELNEGGPKHADSELHAQFISHCTMNNVQHFTLSSRKAKQPTYAMVVLGSSHVSRGKPTS